MGRRRRHLPRPWQLVEITDRTLQSRYLLRPGRQFNEVFVGVLGRAQSLFPVHLHSVICASNHLHLLVSAPDSNLIARFMDHFKTNLSKETGDLYNWPGTVFPRRYSLIPVSDEEEAQVTRLKYHLSHGCKEGVVLSPGDWPGVHSTKALVSGEALEGTWFDRSREYNARTRGEEFDSMKYATQMHVHLDPLPCWSHLHKAERRKRIADLVSQIEDETLAMHAGQGTVPSGPRAARKIHPHHRPDRTKNTPAPRFHAFRTKVRRRLEDAYATFAVAYEEAAARFRSGELNVEFPEDCFPPRLPFVPSVQSLAPG